MSLFDESYIKEVAIESGIRPDEEFVHSTASLLEAAIVTKLRTWGFTADIDLERLFATDAGGLAEREDPSVAEDDPSEDIDKQFALEWGGYVLTDEDIDLLERVAAACDDIGWAEYPYRSDHLPAHYLWEHAQTFEGQGNILEWLSEHNASEELASEFTGLLNRRDNVRLGPGPLGTVEGLLDAFEYGNGIYNLEDGVATAQYAWRDHEDELLVGEQAQIDLQNLYSAVLQEEGGGDISWITNGGEVAELNVSDLRKIALDSKKYIPITFDSVEKAYWTERVKNQLQAVAVTASQGGSRAVVR